MLNWNENAKPRDLDELMEKLNKLVRSMTDWTFLDDVAIAASATGVKVSHGGRSAPVRVFAEIGDVAAAPVLQVKDKTVDSVTIISSADTTVSFAFMFVRK